MDGARIVYENTYQLGPEKVLQPLTIRPLVKEAIRAQFESWSYDGKAAAQKSRDTCAMIQNFILSKGNIPPRYKFSVQAFVIPRADQGLRLATRTLWNPETDNLVSETYDDRKKDYIVVALVFYTYNE